MGREVQLQIKFVFLIIIFNIFVQNCLKSKEQNERDSPFKIDKNFRQKPFRELRLSQYDYCNEATMPGNESIES